MARPSSTNKIILFLVASAAALLAAYLFWSLAADVTALLEHRMGSRPSPSADTIVKAIKLLLVGIIGYLFKKLDYPLAPLVLALVLGDLAENALRQSLIMAQGSPAIFFTRPISAVITAAAVFFFMLPVATPWWRRLRGTPIPAAGKTKGRP